MKKKYPHIDYDLSQNLLLKRREFFRLDHHSLRLSASFYLKKLDLLEALRGVDFEIDDILSGSQIDRIFNDFERNIITKILERFPGLKLKFLDSFVKSTIRLMIGLVISFLKVARVYLMEEHLQHLFVKNIVFTTQITVNTKLTVIRVLDKEDLQPNCMFTLAAQYFLEERVRKYYAALNRKEILSHFKLDIDDDFARYFWVWKIDGSRKPIENSLAYYFGDYMENEECKLDIPKSDFALQNIFLRAAERHNEMAVHYLWENYISKLNARELVMTKVIEKYMRKASHINIVIYLILQAGKEEMTGFLIKEKFNNLMLFYKNKRFIVLFFDILKTFDANFEGYDYFYMLQSIVTTYRKKRASNSDINFFIIFYRKIPRDKWNMLGKFKDSYAVYYDLLRAAFDNSNEDMIGIILGYCPKSEICKFFHSDYGMNLLESIALKLNYEFFSRRLRIYLFEHQIQEIKKSFFELKTSKVYYMFLYMYVDITNLNTFINWFSDSVDFNSILNFRRKFPYLNNGKVTRDLLFVLGRRASIINPFQYAERILEWCVGRENFKKIKLSIKLNMKEDESSEDESPQDSIIKCYANVIECVLKSDWNFLNGIIKWKKCEPEDKISLGKKLLADSPLFEKILKMTNSFNYIYDFYNWVSKDLLFKDKDNDLKIFKAKIFDMRQFFLNQLIMKWDLEGVKNLMIWCDDPVRKIRGMLRDINFDLQEYKPYTEDMQKKYDEFYSWLKSV